MTDRGKLNADVARAQAAEALLGHPMIVDAFDTLTRQVLDDFAASDPKDTMQLSMLRIRLQCIQDFKGVFDHFLRTGKIAAHEIERQDTEEKIRKSGLTG